MSHWTSLSVSARYLRLAMSWLGCILQSCNLSVGENSDVQSGKCRKKALRSPFSTFFPHGGKSLAIGKGLNPRMTSQQPNLSRICDLRISIAFSCRILPTRTISLFFASVTECTCAFRFWSLDSSGAPHYGSLFTFTWHDLQHPWHKIKTFRCVRWSIQAFLSSAAKCCELMFARLFAFTFVVSAFVCSWYSLL